MVFLLLLPSFAVAHAGQQGLVLLLPTDIYIVTGGLAVAVTVLLASILGHQPLLDLFAPKRVFALPAPRQVVSSLLAMLALGAAIWVGLFGPSDPLANLMTLGVWTLFWILFVLLCGIFGNLWAWVNPWSGLFTLLAGSNAKPLFKLPKWVGVWPAILGWLAFNGFGISSPSATDPILLGVLASLYWMFNFVMMMVFGPVWLQRGEFLTVFIGLIARVSPFARDPQGLDIGWPGWRTAKDIPPLTLSLFALVLLGTGTFDGFNETFFWLAQLGINPLAFPGRSAIITETLIGLICANVALVLVFFLCLRISAGTAPFSELFRRQALAILPIALAYHFAHFLPSLLVNIQYSVKAFNDPVQSGADFLQLGQFYVTTGFFNTSDTVRLIFLTQAGGIVIGHILAILIAHRVAVDYFEGRWAVISSQIPLSLFMIGYTILGLWLLATPKGA